MLIDDFPDDDPADVLGDDQEAADFAASAHMWSAEARACRLPGTQDDGPDDRESSPEHR